MRSACQFLLLMVSAWTISGCGLPYYWQAVGGQISILRQRTPIESVLTDAAQDPAVKASLRGVAAIRRFAVDRLMLPDNDSYTSYVELDRSYVVWNVIAAEEFSVDAKTWCFPFAGCVAYRGFFDRADAERFQAGLERQGLDTHSGGASAYSTLGYFDDPILNTMLTGGEEYIAALLFHELAHQQLYIKDDSELSEAFATSVEEYGMEAWLKEHYQTEDIERYRQRHARRTQFDELVSRQQSRLREIYAGQLSDQDKRARKLDAFIEMRSEYETMNRQWGGSGDYDAWFAQPLNNATLAAVATYRRWLPALRWRLDELGTVDFFAEIARLAELPATERSTWLEAWSEKRSAPGGLAQL